MTTLLTNLVSWWELGEASGSRADSHGSNTLSATGSPGNTTGKVGNAALLNSTSKYLRSSSSQLYPGSGNFGLAFWVKLGAALAGATENIIVCGRYTASGNLRSFAFQIQGDSTAQGLWRGLLSTDGTGAGTTLVGTGSYVTQARRPVNEWHHIVLTRNASTATLYVDGTFEASTSFSSTLYNNTASVDFSVNGQGDASATASMTVDQLGYWSRELTTVDVAALYNVGNGVAYADLATLPSGSSSQAAGIQQGLYMGSRGVI